MINLYLKIYCTNACGSRLPCPLPSVPTMIEKAKLVISNAAAEFPAIIGAPTNDDLKRICKFFANLLQSIDILGGYDNLSGLTDTPSKYLTT